MKFWTGDDNVRACRRVDRAELAALEADLSLEAVAHFRAGVAAQHSRHLAECPAVLQHAMDAINVVIGTPGRLPEPVMAMLFQHGSGSSEHGQPRAGLLRACVSVACPKLGLQLLVGDEWMALTPRVPSAPFCSLEAAFRSVSLTLPSSGSASLACESLVVGGLTAQDRPLSAVVVQSPSSHCRRLLAIADLHAAATRSQLKSGPAKLGGFLSLSLGRASVAELPQPRCRDHGAEWALGQPLGLQVDVELAGIEVRAHCGCLEHRFPLLKGGRVFCALLVATGLSCMCSQRVASTQLFPEVKDCRGCTPQVMHNTDAVVAALSFFGQLERLKNMPLAHSAADPTAAQARQLVFDPKQPPTLAERAKQAFAAHNLPIQKEPSLPVTTLYLECPGG